MKKKDSLQCGNQKSWRISNHKKLTSITLQSGILNDLSAQSALPLSDNFSYVFDTDGREYWIGKSLKTA